MNWPSKYGMMQHKIELTVKSTCGRIHNVIPLQCRNCSLDFHIAQHVDDDDDYDDDDEVNDDDDNDDDDDDDDILDADDQLFTWAREVAEDAKSASWAA